MRVNSESEMLAFGRNFAKNLKLPAVIELIGDVGAGKTTFTRGLAQGLNINEKVTSPSFTISRRYHFVTSNQEDGELVHYDFYRLDNPGIIRDELAETTVMSNTVVVIEWGGDVIDLLPKIRHQLKISQNDDGSRTVETVLLRQKDSKTDPSTCTLVKSAQPVENLWKTCGKTSKNCAKKPNNGGKPVENSRKLQKIPKNLQTPEVSEMLETSETPQNSLKNPIKLYLDTSTDTCILRINDREYQRTGKYDLAEKILSFIHDKLQENAAGWYDIAEISFFSGPGSFTGLRIGAAVVNALASQLQIPLFDHLGQRQQIILPNYGRPANVTPPRK